MNSAKIIELLTLVLPIIKKLIESKVVPMIKRKAYQRLDDFTNDRIEDLSCLVEKINNCDDEIKRKAHLEGLRLGIEAIRAIGDKLLLAASEFERMINVG